MEILTLSIVFFLFSAVKGGYTQNIYKRLFSVVSSLCIYTFISHSQKADKIQPSHKNVDKSQNRLQLS